jgi:hypothetical protein
MEIRDAHRRFLENCHCGLEVSRSKATGRTFRIRLDFRGSDAGNTDRTQHLSFPENEQPRIGWFSRTVKFDDSVSLMVIIYPFNHCVFPDSPQLWRVLYAITQLKSPSHYLAHRLVPSREDLIEKLSQFPLESLTDSLSARAKFPSKLLRLSYPSSIRLLDIISM